jgi:hypothetical protein
VVIRFSSKADCRVISGIVTTPPPWPSRPTFSTLMTVMAQSYSGATRGPFLIWLRSPELAAKVDALGAYCRFEASINERLRKLSLLIAARHFDAQYSWNAHHKKAIEAGVTADSIKELATKPGQRPKLSGKKTGDPVDN